MAVRTESVQTEAGRDFLGKLPHFSAETVTDGRMAWTHVLTIEHEMRATTYASVLRGLRSEDDSPQLRAIIASVEDDAGRY